MSLLGGMNSKQKEAVESTEGPLLVMAGAGSGKTRVLTHRVAYIIERNLANPWNILAITFTNKAAREMKERIESLLGTIGSDVWIFTFHSLCVRILRREVEKIGYSSQFTIIDSGEQKTLMKRLLAELNLDSKKFDVRRILGTISYAKNEINSPTEYEKNAKGFYEQTVAKLYKRYQQELRQNEAMDFDDLIVNTLCLFQKFPEILEQYQEKFRYIHVDEYQDTNYVQYCLVTLLAEKFRNLCVVGDADQSIYGWRGADMKNILNFEKDYPEARVILLEQNYRSTKKILAAANGIIQNNLSRSKKELWTKNVSGEKIVCHCAKNEQEESNFVIEEILKQICEKNRSYNDFAVLYRTNVLSRVMEESLLKANIPYTMVGAQKFYDRKEIKDLIAYLNVIANPRDGLSFVRIANKPKRGIGAISIEKLREFATFHGISLLEASGSATLAGISGKAAQELASFQEMIVKLRKFSLKEDASITDLVEKILKDTGYSAELERQATLESENRLENLEEFLSVTKNFDKNFYEEEGIEKQEKLSIFLNDLSLISDVDSLEEDNAQQVTLMTLHAVKGLEFPIVFLLGMEEGIFPLSRSILEKDELEEERRLAYVGITRAEQELYLLSAKSRTLYGKTNWSSESRFIGEIDQKLLRRSADNLFPFSDYLVAKKSGVSSKINHGKQVHSSKSSMNQENFAIQWQMGEKVSHKIWGIGTIVKISENGKDLDVAFPDKGIKRLAAAYAPIVKV
ncbi:MAG: DNA helicase PcrA [Lactobacillales bacterium]|jgi:DNA helicase-2/ATP-dependent DNA helicase PcrA|nr:DNA helicase PcrA [Lactobacillales bacterium]